jgi:hypothetical protein
MTVKARAMATGPRTPSARDRLAGRFILLLLVIGSLMLWIGIPWGGMWLTGEIADTKAAQFLYALLLIPATMATFALGLVWVNNLHLRITGIHRGNGGDEPGSWRRIRGPLEPLLVQSLMFAVVAMLVWFFLFAENPPSCSGNP